jgi:acyl carrier protein
MTHGDGGRVAARGAEAPATTDVPAAVSTVNVYDVFRDVLGVRVPDDDTDVIATGLLDSLGVAELLLTLEERFDVTIDMASLDLDDIRSVRSIVALLTRLVDERGREP